MYKGQDYYQSGTYQVGNRKIKDHNGGAGWGSITFDEGVERSSNVAFAILGDQTGQNVFENIFIVLD